MRSLSYNIEYGYFYEEQDTAWVTYELYSLLSKLDVAISKVEIKQDHVGDVALKVSYSYRRLQTIRPTSST